MISRTGTWSTAHALTTLLGCSIDKIHHGMQLRSHSNLDFWIQALTGKVTDQEWKDFFQGIFKNSSCRGIFVKLIIKINSLKFHEVQCALATI